MHQLKIASGRPARIAAAVTDELECQIANEAARHGLKPSQYIEMVMRDDIGSKACLRDLPITAATFKLHEDMRKAMADGKLSPVERESLTDDISEILSGVRKRTA